MIVVIRFMVALAWIWAVSGALVVWAVRCDERDGEPTDRPYWELYAVSILLGPVLLAVGIALFIKERWRGG